MRGTDPACADVGSLDTRAELRERAVRLYEESGGRPSTTGVGHRHGRDERISVIAARPRTMSISSIMRIARLGSLIAMLAVLAACGPEVGPLGRGSELDGLTFLSTEVTEAGEPRALVPGTRIRLSFQDGRIAASAGCNSMGSTYRVDEGLLRIGEAAVTEMGCDEPRHRQDDWLFGLLGEGPRVELVDDTLTLTLDATVITLLDRQITDPDRPLVGTRWVLDGIIVGQVASSVPDGVEAWIELADDTTVSLHTGCNSGSGTVDIRNGTVTFSAIGLTRVKCEGARGEVERAMLAVLVEGDVDYTIEASLLELSRGENGLTFVAG